MASSQAFTQVELDRLSQTHIVRSVELGQELPHWPPSLDRMGIRPMVYPSRDPGVSKPLKTISPLTKLQIRAEMIRELREELAQRLKASQD